MGLLERAAPISTLLGLREAAISRGGQLVWVEGEAGVGKTSLLTAFRDALPDDARMLLGNCDPISTPRPLGPLADIAEELGPEFRRMLAGGHARPDILAALLASIRGLPGLVLCLDDLHWADEATLDALRFVGRRVATTGALIVGTYRDDELGPDHPLRVVVGELATSPAVHRLPLAPLSLGAVRTLASGSGMDADTLFRQTGGNPFFVTEVLAGPPTGVPPTVRDAVLARVARLSPPARRTLEAAAVIGPTVEPGLLIRVVDPVAADQCLAGGLLVVHDGRYAFRHEVAREAVLSATDPSVRIRLHGRVLAALEAETGAPYPLALLAHHADAAGDRAAVLRYAPAAARQAAAAGANREAAAHFDRAVRAAGSMPAAERAELLHACAAAHATVGRADLALSAYGEAAGVWRRLDESLQEARAACGMANALVGLGRNADAEAASRRALDLTAASPASAERVEALMTQAYLRMLDRDNADAITLGREVIGMDASVRPPETLASALNLVGSARILLDDPDGRDDLLKAIRVAEAASIPSAVRSAYGNLGSAFGEMYHLAEAERWLDAGIRVAGDWDLDASYQEAWRALVLVHRGRWREGESQAWSVARRPHTSAISRTMALLALGRLKARRGDPDAGAILDEALQLAEPTGTLQRIGPVRAARAEAAWLAGEQDRCGLEAEAAFELAARHRHPWHVGELGWWMTRAARDPRDTSIAAEPWRAQLAGRWREAAAAWAARDCPYEAARAALDGDDAEAVKAAHGTFDALGAVPAAALAANRLRELGMRAIPRGRRATTRDNPAGLTVRELEVLALVVAGYPNAEIARRLYLSPRTVDHHVSAVLAKLSVARRQDAGAAAERLGIRPQDGQGDAPG